MKQGALRIALAALVTTFMVETSAQPSLEQARIFFDAGVQAYTAGRYKDAVESFQEAYTLSGKPQAVFSLAQAERRLYIVTQDTQYLRAAIDHLRKYLEVVKEGGRRGDAAEALEQLELIAAREIKPAEPTETAPVVVQGKILISTTAPGAAISVDGGKGSESPFIDVVKPGKHLVRVVAPGYISEEREIVAIENSLVPLEVTLREEPSFLAIAAKADAIITIDGRSYGEAPLDKRIELHRGTHVVTASLSGHYPYRETVRLEPGQTTSMKISLTRTRQRYVSYALTGAGAASLVAAGIFGGVALQNESTAEELQATRGLRNLTHAELDEYNSAVLARDQFRSFSLIGMAGAGILGVAGAITYIYDLERPSDAGTNQDKVALSFTVVPLTSGLRVGVRF